MGMGDPSRPLRPGHFLLSRNVRVVFCRPWPGIRTAGDAIGRAAAVRDRSRCAWLVRGFLDSFNLLAILNPGCMVRITIAQIARLQHDYPLLIPRDSSF